MSKTKPVLIMTAFVLAIGTAGIMYSDQDRAITRGEALLAVLVLAQSARMAIEGIGK